MSFRVVPGATVPAEEMPSDIKNMQVLAIKPGEHVDRAASIKDDTNLKVEGNDDAINPLNWPTRKKVVHVAIISFITFLTPLASTFFAPAVQNVMVEFKSNNDQLASFVVTSYLLGYCFGPLLLAPLSELYGRVWVYNTCNILFLIFNIACALSPNLAALIIFRMLAGFAGCCPLAIGAGTIADLFRHEHRGKAMAAWILGPIFGPGFGPLAGGYLVEAKGWRWLFWLLAILAGINTLVSLLFLRETYAPLLISRNAPQADDYQQYGKHSQSPYVLFVTAIKRPTELLLFSPIIFFLSLYTAITYGYLYLIMTSMPEVFESIYGFSQGGVGLTFMGFNIGSVLGILLIGGISDRVARRLQKRYGGEMKPEYRLPPMLLSTIAVPAGLLLYGWSAEKHLHWIVPVIGTALLGGGLIIALMASGVYFVDAYTTHAASASAAATVMRSLLGALLPLCGRQMFAKLGLGWGSSLLAFVALVLAPMPLVFYKYGEGIRKRTAHRFSEA